MDFDKTSFLVDWYTPSGANYARNRISFPKSARISIDDFTLDSPVDVCFNTDGEVIQRPRSCSLASSYSPPQPEGLACCWSNDAPSLPPASTDGDVDSVYDHHAQESEDKVNSSAVLASLGLDFLADDDAFCGLDFDFSCLDGLDEQLLLSPIDSFTELCWAETVDEEGCMPVPVRHKKNARSCARSFKYDSKPALPLSTTTTKDYSRDIEPSRPLVAKIMLPHETCSDYLSSPSSESFVTSSPTSEQIPFHFLYTDPAEYGVRFPTQPDQTIRLRPFLKKRDVVLASPPHLSKQDHPQKSRLRTARSTSALRIVTDACTSLTARALKTAVAH